MALLSRSPRRPSIDIWPGFVDALSQLLMVIIFLLLVFTAGQVYLSQALSGRDKLLDRLQRQVNALGDMLSLQRQENANLRLGATHLSLRLEKALAAQKKSANEASALAAQSRALEGRLASSESALALAEKSVAAKSARVAALQKGNAATESALAGEKEVSRKALLEVETLGAEITALRMQLANLAAALDLANAKVKTQNEKIADLGKRLNLALVQKLDKLALYRSEFFGKLRKIIGDRSGIRIVGDRFVFSARVLFAPGSAHLSAPARQTLAPVFAALKEISAKIPPNIHWILQIDGFTDATPIDTARFPSNWELSAGRAISVVRYAVKEGIPRDHVAAEGYGDTHPLDPAKSPQAYRRNRRIELRLTQR